MPTLITARTGYETHSSSWGKFVVRGLALVAENRSQDRHASYADAVVEATDGAIFTVWAADGDKRGTDSAEFYICQVTDAEDAETRHIEGGHSRGGAFIEGKFVVLAEAKTITKAKRLLSWWADWAPEHGGLNAVTARHLAEQIEKRGKALPDPIPATAWIETASSVPAGNEPAIRQKREL